MKFSILHTTARVKPMGSFPHGWLGACRQWLWSAVDPRDVEYVVVVHESRIGEFWSYLGGGMAQLLPSWGRFQVVVNYGRDCVVDQANAGLLAVSGEITVGISDDLVAPEGWDASILAAIPQTDLPIALGCNPRERQDLLVFPSICTRALQQRIGPLPPEYESMFVDNEWSDQARRLGTVKEIALHFDHPHPILNGRNETDAVYEMQNRPEAYKIGRAVYEARKAAGFPRPDLKGWDTLNVPVSDTLDVCRGCGKRGRYDAEPDPLNGYCAACNAMRSQLSSLPFLQTGRASQVQGESLTRGKLPSGLKRTNPMTRALDWIEDRLNPPAAPPQPTALREIAICTPGESHRADWEACFYGVLGTLSSAGWRVEPRLGYSTNVYGVRMVMTDDLIALGVPFEYVLWIDDDNHLTGPQSLRMIEYLDQHPDVDGIVAWCWIKIKTPQSKDWVWIVSCGSFSGNGINMTPMPFEKLFADTEVKPIEATGFPVFLMRYKVLQTLGSKAFRPVFHEGCALGFSGEDLAFCKAAKEAGFQFVVDPALKVPHMKWRADEPDLVIHAGAPEEGRKELEAWLEQNNGKPLHVPAYELMEGKKM